MTTGILVLGLVASCAAAGLAWTAGALFERGCPPPAQRFLFWTLAFWEAPLLAAGTIGAARLVSHIGHSNIAVVAVAATSSRILERASPSGMGISLGAALLALFAGGVVLRLASLAWRLVLLANVVRRSRPLPPDVRTLLEAQLRDLPHLRLRISDGLASPILAGVVRPVVLLPARLAAVDASEAAALVCRHEAAHLRRRDNLALILEELVLALFWCNLPLHALRRRMVAAREELCDLAAIGAADTGARRLYAGVLVESFRAKSPSLPAIGLLGLSRRHATMRISAILNPRSAPVPNVTLVAILLGVGLSAAAIDGFAAAAAAPQSAQSPAGRLSAASDQIDAVDASGTVTFSGHVRLTGAAPTSATVVVDGHAIDPGSNLSELPELASVTFYKSSPNGPVRRVEGVTR